MEKLRAYLKTLSPDDQDAFAKRVGTTIGYLRNALSTGKRLGPNLVIAIERETNGAVRCEDLRPDVPWHVLRGSEAA